MAQRPLPLNFVAISLLLLVCCCLSSPCYGAQPTQVHIYPPGTMIDDIWTGNCTGPGPFVFTAPGATYEDEVGNCDLFFEAGEWPDFSWKTNVAGLARIELHTGITFGPSFSFLQLSFESELGSISMVIPQLNNVKLDIKVLSNVSVHPSLETAGGISGLQGTLTLKTVSLDSIILVENITITSSNLLIDEIGSSTPLYQTINITNVHFMNGVGATFAMQWSTISQETSPTVYINNCTAIFNPFDTFIVGIKNATIYLTNTNIQVNSYLLETPYAQRLIQLDNSNVIYGQQFISTPLAVLTEDYIVKLFLIRGSSLFGDSGTKIGCFYAVDLVLNGQSRLEQVSFPNLARIFTLEAFFTNTIINITSATMWTIQQTTFLMDNTATESSLFISDSSGYAIDVMVRAIGGDAKFLLSGEVTFKGNSMLTVNVLYIASEAIVSIPHLYVSSSINCDTPCTQLPTLSSLSSTANTTWKFGTISITDVNVNISNVDYFIYTPTHEGTNGRGIDLVNSASLTPLPTSIRIIWPYLTPPSSLSTYNISEFEEHTSNQTFDAIYYPGEIYHFKTFFSNKLLTFQLMFLPPTYSSCPTPHPVGFNCVNGVLIAIGSITEPNIVFQPNSGTVQVFGNLSVTTTITFNGFGTTLNVSGCADIPNIEIDLTKEKTIPKTPVVLVTQGSGCSNSLLDTQLTVKQLKSCKKTSAKNDVSSSSFQLSVLFSVDSSSCNTRWIILGSVLGAVLLIVVIIALVFSLNPAAKACIRPYVNRKAAKTL
jgi:hypothetical protein